MDWSSLMKVAKTIDVRTSTTRQRSNELAADELAKQATTKTNLTREEPVKDSAPPKRLRKKGSSAKKKREEVGSASKFAARFQDSFVAWMEEDYKKVVEERRSHRVEGYHASSLDDVCGRRRYFLEVAKLFTAKFDEDGAVDDSVLTETAETTGAMLTADEGHALHDLWQNNYLGPWGVLVGRWHCVFCEKTCGTSMSPVSMREFEPAVCPVNPRGEHRLEFVESRVHIRVTFTYKGKTYTFDVVGSTDGLLRYGNEIVVGELKSKSVAQFGSLASISFPHKQQVHAYMRGLEKDKAVVIYFQKGKIAAWSKNEIGVWQTSKLHVRMLGTDFEDDTWGFILNRIAGDVLVAQGAETDVAKIPMVCGSATCSTAKSCPVSDACFDQAKHFGSIPISIDSSSFTEEILEV